MTHVFRCSGYELAKSNIVEGHAAGFTDDQGRRFVDFESGVWCAVLGHGHPRVLETIRNQSSRLMHIGYRFSSVEVEAAAAAVLESLTWPDGRCVFLSSGSEAVEWTVQVARRLTGRPLLLRLTDAYLSAYGSAGSETSDTWAVFDWTACTECDDRDRCDADCPHLREIPFERIGGFCFEPGNSGGRVKLPPRGIVSVLAERIQDEGGLLLVDEVTTGLGRTGTWYGFEHYGIQPDLVALGKGLGNGYPVSAVAMRPAIAEALLASGFHYAQSHQNDPMACAVATTVLEVLRDEGWVERSSILGERFLKRLRELADRHPAAIAEIRGRGLMIVMELSAERGRDPATTAFERLLKRGILVGCKPAARLLRFYPPLMIAENEIDRLLSALDEILP